MFKVGDKVRWGGPYGLTGRISCLKGKNVVVEIVCEGILASIVVRPEELRHTDPLLRLAHEPFLNPET